MLRVLIGLLLVIPLLSSGQTLSWPQWVAELRKEALAVGVRPSVFDNAFRGVSPNKKVVHLDRTQPERRLTFLEYRKTRIDSYRITLGRKAFKRNQALLSDISQNFGVDPCVITAIWGLETSYGNFMGSFPVIKSLATLAYDGRRSKFFRKELLVALQILNEEHITLDKFKGEWAGASGHPQFLPSSWRKYAVDFDGDGHKNIWSNKRDALASIANYLKQNGWVQGLPWGIEVDLPAGFAPKQIDKNNKKSIAQWLRLGVKPRGQSIPKSSTQAYLVKPNGGPTFMVFANFNAIKSYNPSTFYVGSVGYLSDQICQRT